MQIRKWAYLITVSAARLDLLSMMAAAENAKNLYLVKDPLTMLTFRCT